jgi:RNA polymerase sigma-70 factor (ECF subfamily)
MNELVAGHRAFVAFVGRRVGDRAIAENIVQDAFVKGPGSSGDLRADESSRAWFYLVLRNAIIDRHRRAPADRHLPPDQATALRRIELEGVAVKDFAVEAGLGESNAGIRVFRNTDAWPVRAASHRLASQGAMSSRHDLVRRPG